jgi:hypothetical protein
MSSLWEARHGGHLLKGATSSLVSEGFTLLAVEISLSQSCPGVIRCIACSGTIVRSRSGGYSSGREGRLWRQTALENGLFLIPHHCLLLLLISSLLMVWRVQVCFVSCPRLEVDILQLLVVLLQLSLVLVESGEVVLDPLLQLEGLELATHGGDEAVLREG